MLDDLLHACMQVSAEIMSGLRFLMILIAAVTLFMSLNAILYTSITAAVYETEAYMNGDYYGYGSAADLLYKVKELGEEIVREGNWTYSGRGTQKNLAAARKSAHPRTNCAVAVSLAMQEAGILEENQFFYAVEKGKLCGSMAVKKRLNRHFKIIETGGRPNGRGVKLEPGDVCLWNTHVNVYAGRQDGKKIWYDFGRRSVSDHKANSGHYVRYIRKGATGNTLYKILRCRNQKPRQSGKQFRIPAGLGDTYTYMGWSIIHNWPTRQYYLRERSGEHYDKNGFAIVDGRYVIACTTTFGDVGDYIDFVLDNGRVIHAIMGDEKSQKDRGCNRWGHDQGHSVVEFVVNKKKWYHHLGNNDIVSFHPEWKSRVKMGINLGKNYFDR